MENQDIVLIIPAYNPDEKFIHFLEQLTLLGGYKEIIVVDDGSSDRLKPIFETAKDQYGCQIIKHYVNLGQGRAFKTAFNYFIGKYGNNPNIIGVIECDCDGQHILEDIDKCAKLLRMNHDKFILGVRNFNNKNVPFRSRFGNKCTNFVFKFLCGLNVRDTQTGLKGIPKKYVYDLIEAPGERFEYASSVLLTIKSKGVEILQFDINTIYLEGNITSHFNPLLDSIRIYSLIFKYLLSSLSASVVDLLVFSIMIILTQGHFGTFYIIASTYTAKIVSCTYSYFVNKNFVFSQKENKLETVLKWAILCVIQATLSGCLTQLLVDYIKWNEVICKILIDITLFFFSFQIQNRWVFKGVKRNEHKNK